MEQRKKEKKAAKKLHPRRDFAIRRLLSDLKEVQANPLRNANALPFNDNLLVWHGNLVSDRESDYGTAYFHIKIKFSYDYPIKPPKIVLCTPLSHPNVFGSGKHTYICLDMLETGYWGETQEVNRPYTGWSSAYTVQSLLVQLAAFFLDTDTMGDGYSFEGTREQCGAKARRFECKQCGHAPGQPWPSFRSTSSIAGEIYEDLMKEFFPKPVVVPAAIVPKPLAKALPSKEKEATKAVVAPLVPEEGWEIVKGKKGASAATPATSSNLVLRPVLTDETNRYQLLDALVTQEQEEKKAQKLREERRVKEEEEEEERRRRAGNKENRTAEEANKKKTAINRNLRRKMHKLKKKELEEKQKEEERKAEEEKERQKKKEEEKKAREEKQRILVERAREEERILEEQRRKEEEERRKKRAEELRRIAEEEKQMEIERKRQEKKVRRAKMEEARKKKEKEEQEKKALKEQREKEGRQLLGLDSDQPLSAIQKRNLRRKKLRELKRIKEGRALPVQTPVVPASQIVASAAVEVEEEVIDAIPVGDEDEEEAIHANEAEEKEEEKEANEEEDHEQNGSNPWETFSPKLISVAAHLKPVPSSVRKQQIRLKKKVEKHALVLEDLPEEVILAIVVRLRPQDLFSFARTNYRMYRISTDSAVWQSLLQRQFAFLGVKGSSSRELQRAYRNEVARIKDSLCCFHSKVSFTEDVLGIPISVKYGGNTVGGRRYILELSSPLDLLSRKAFSIEGLRKSVWKEPFTHWLPIYINAEHAQRAKVAFRTSVCSIMGTGGVYNAFDTLSLLPKLMNTMVVEVMSSKIHASIKALEGYCWFHRLLIQQVTEVPALQKEVESRIARFIGSPEGRTKSAIPALGEWLPLLAVSQKYSWTDVAIPYIKENFDRNVKWVLQKYPELKRQQAAAGQPDHDRLDKTFIATQVSIRLCLFHVYFLRIAKPAGASLSEIARGYDAFFGMPSHELKESLQKEIFKIQKVDTWPEFFRYVGIKCPSAEQLTSMLQHSVKNSMNKGYH